jgi:type IV secretion system protein VirD4
MEEIENFAGLSLMDFSINPDSIIKPTTQPLTFEDIKAAAQRYLNIFIET